MLPRLPVCEHRDALGARSREKWVSARERHNAHSQACPKSYEFGSRDFYPRESPEINRLGQSLPVFGHHSGAVMLSARPASSIAPGSFAAAERKKCFRRRPPRATALLVFAGENPPRSHPRLTPGCTWSPEPSKRFRTLLSTWLMEIAKGGNGMISVLSPVADHELDLIRAKCSDRQGPAPRCAIRDGAMAFPAGPSVS
jgi:hypothetical protein